MAAKRLLAAALSDPGRERENNEDRVICDPERGIYAVIDGVGGESGGEIAAQTAKEILEARLSRRTTDAARLIREAIALANKQIWERAEANPALAGMACVLTVAVVDGDQATIGHVGDSRLYLLRPGEIRKVTRDHSPIGAREDVGEISEAEAMAHPRRNEIFRDVGSAPHEPDEEGFIDVTRIAFAPDSALLLCSDGLSDLVTSEAIRTAVEARADDPRQAVADLIAAANAAGGKDNVSAVLVEGERYAASVRAAAGTSATATTATTPTTRPDLRRAQHASRSGLGWLLAAFVSRPAFLIYGLILGAFAVAALGQSGLLPVHLPLGSRAASGDVVRVGVGDGGVATIREALEKAQPGQTIEVAPGNYPETVQLRSGIDLVSRVPRGAVILPPAGSAVPAVSAQGVDDALFSGFRIAGDPQTPQTPLQVGLRLADSSVDVQGVEVTGAATAAVDVAGDDRSTVRASFLHDNPGGGVLIAGNAAPTLLNNLIAGNGRAPGAARAGVVVRDAARPVLIENRLVGNGGGGVALTAPERADEVFAWNSFAGASRAEAVRVAAAPAPQKPGRNP
ncbi:MAG TPA: protein phosphatase 2C domain-containing protein [Thermoanaerobaculia bacterium]|jgi:serine/threonine protein phosphatase PrpC|nr:protein phosphatase 2C domain-containing protein [Thermoanaerobaculia bacterium]